MKKRPLSIIIISLIYFFEPAGNVLQAAFVNDMPVFGEFGILSHLLWSDWVILFLFPVVAVGVYTVRRWGWYLFLLFSVILIGYNLFVYTRNPNYALETVLLFIAVITLMSAFFLRKHVYAPYFSPRLRWWEHAARYRVVLRSRILTDGGAHDCTTLDISESGCFLGTEAVLEEGTLVMVKIQCKGVELDCLGRVVRKSGEKERVRGYGIMFQGLPRDTRRNLRLLILSLEEMNREERKDLIQDADIPLNFWKRRHAGLTRWWVRLRAGLRCMSPFQA